MRPNRASLQVKKMTNILFLLILTLSIPAFATDQELAFEGALGFGKYTQGGKNAEIYRVTSLEDNDEPGTLRYGIKLKQPRQIHFDVSGVIQLNKPLKIKHGFLSILGQTSPHGIAIVGAPVSIHANQVIMQHLRIRLGTYGYEDDALFARYVSDIIIANCSFSWSTDETVSLYGNTRLTLQNSIIANSLNDSIHKKGQHGYGGIWGGNKATFINNVIANHKSRTPRINGHRLGVPYPQEQEYVEVINNVIFNWGSNSSYGNESGRVSIVGNYYIPGPDSKNKHFFDQSYDKNNPPNQLYVAANHMHGNTEVSVDNRLAVIVRNKSKSKMKGKMIAEQVFAKQSYQPLTPYIPAQQALNSLVINKNVGAFLTRNGSFHDSIDTTVLNQIEQGLNVTAKHSLLIDHENQNVKDFESYASEFK
ncbi:MAG: hypothetical protein HWE10_12435 [Gammaproteobacteria bacterium]|nr:hypothetical protein [Gammaproteobacteria bacterium]